MSLETTINIAFIGFKLKLVNYMNENLQNAELNPFKDTKKAVIKCEYLNYRSQLLVAFETSHFESHRRNLIID